VYGSQYRFDRWRDVVELEESRHFEIVWAIFQLVTVLERKFVLFDFSKVVDEDSELLALGSFPSSEVGEDRGFESLKTLFDSELGFDSMPQDSEKVLLVSQTISGLHSEEVSSREVVLISFENHLDVESNRSEGGN
jgi:hypothetical protein